MLRTHERQLPSKRGEMDEGEQKCNDDAAWWFQSTIKKNIHKTELTAKQKFSESSNITASQCYLTGSDMLADAALDADVLDAR